MKKKYKFNMKSMPKAYNRIGESFLEILCNYIIISFLLVLIGLVFTDGTGRGFPIPWLKDGHISVTELVISLGTFGAITIIADIIARIDRTRENDFRSQYKSANVIANNSSNVVINDNDDFGMPKLVAPKSKASSNSSESKDSRDNEKTNRITSTMLNHRVSSPDLNSKAIIIIVAIITLIIVKFLGNISIYDYQDNGFWDDGYEEYYDYEDDDSLDPFELTAIRTIDNYLVNEDPSLTDVIEGIREEDVEELYDFTDWYLLSYNDFSTLGDSFNGNEAVVKLYALTGDDEIIFVAFKIIAPDGVDASDVSDPGSELSDYDVSDLRITGLSVVSGIDDLLDDDYDLNSSLYSNDEWKAIEEIVKKDSFSIGDSSIDNTPILLYAW